MRCSTCGRHHLKTQSTAREEFREVLPRPGRRQRGTPRRRRPGRTGPPSARGVERHRANRARHVWGRCEGGGRVSARRPPHRAAPYRGRGTASDRSSHLVPRPSTSSHSRPARSPPSPWWPANPRTPATRPLTTLESVIEVGRRLSCRPRGRCTSCHRLIGAHSTRKSRRTGQWQDRRRVRHRVVRQCSAIVGGGLPTSLPASIVSTRHDLGVAQIPGTPEDSISNNLHAVTKRPSRVIARLMITDRHLSRSVDQGDSHDSSIRLVRSRRLRHRPSCRRRGRQATTPPTQGVADRSYRQHLASTVGGAHDRAERRTYLAPNAWSDGSVRHEARGHSGRRVLPRMWRYLWGTGRDGQKTGVRLTGQLICRDDREAAVVARHLPDHVALTRREPGCLSFAVSSTSNPLVWNVEEWFTHPNTFAPHRPASPTAPGDRRPSPSNALRDPPTLVATHRVDMAAATGSRPQRPVGCR